MVKRIHSDNKKRMLIVSGLFFNRVGNQSMYNSVKYYNEEYNIDLVTAANFCDKYYFNPDMLVSGFSNFKIYKVWLSSCLKLFIRTSTKNKSDPSNSSTLGLLNYTPSKIGLLVFQVKGLLLLFVSLPLILIKKPSVICLYEINALLVARFLKLFSSKTLIFAKFQGTALGNIYGKDDFDDLLSINYPLEKLAMKNVKYIDAAIMTNDGTHGKAVLKHFGYDEKRILFIPNGIDNRVLEIRNHHTIKKTDTESHIKLISVSRLIPWKRVPKAVKAANNLIQEGYALSYNIIGDGNEFEVDAVLKEISSTKEKNSISYLGPKNYKETLEHIMESDLLISVYSVSNVCNPVFEALALGVPVLTIYSETLLEVLGDRSEGCFFVEEIENEPIELSIKNKLREISKEQIQMKKYYLKNLDVNTWQNRVKNELEFINSINVNI